MQRIPLRSILAAACVILFAADRAQAAPIVWNEIGDAGDFTTPQDVTGGLYDEIHGDIGSFIGSRVDTFDVFAFHWATAGDFAAVEVGGEIAHPGLDVFLALYDYSGRTVGSLLAGSGPSTTGISAANLPVGDYLLAVAIPCYLDPTDPLCPGPDPPYAITITGPSQNPIGSQPVPEPSTFVLLAGGLAALARRCRQSRRLPS